VQLAECSVERESDFDKYVSHVSLRTLVCFKSDLFHLERIQLSMLCLGMGLQYPLLTGFVDAITVARAQAHTY
jgi:hypothetical protein